MDLSSVVKGRRVISQPVEDREPLAGYQWTAPVTRVSHVSHVNHVSQSAVVETVVEENDISIRKVESVEEQTGAVGGAWSSASPAAVHPHPAPGTSATTEEEMVVDMQQTRQLQDCVKVREVGLLEKDLSISVRGARYTSSCKTVDDSADLQILEEVEELPKKGLISYGDDCDVIQLLNEIPNERGVICRKQQVLHCDGGSYEEGEQYRIIPGTQSKGAFGEAAMCEDLTTKKIFMRKTVKSKLSRNEIEVPLMFRGNVGIPEVYGVNIKDRDTEIFQEFAGLSLKTMMELRPDYAQQLRDPKMMMVLAFQAFATLHKLHSQGVTHQDIKPENLCLEIQPSGVWRLKFIDFGSSQTPKDQVMEGLTNEYLSPESCDMILRIATEQLAKEAGRLGSGLDVWGLSLSLLYCLCGYHVMVYVCTGHTKYQEQDPSKLQMQRMQCLLKIRALKDEDIMRKLIHPDWPEELKTLLVNTLRVDPNLRWSAKDAAEFILRNWILKGAGAGSQQSQPVPAVGPTVNQAAAPQLVTPAPTPPTPPSPPAQAPASPSAAGGIVFRGLNPSKLVVQTQMSVSQDSEERTVAMQAVQCSSPAREECSQATPVGPPSPSSSEMDLPPPSPSPSQLPDFTGLLSNGTTSKKTLRRTRGKQRLEPYHQPCRRGSKNI